jgi:hypothetical protein
MFKLKEILTIGVEKVKHIIPILSGGIFILIWANGVYKYKR